MTPAVFFFAISCFITDRHPPRLFATAAATFPVRINKGTLVTRGKPAWWARWQRSGAACWQIEGTYGIMILQPEKSVVAPSVCNPSNQKPKPYLFLCRNSSSEIIARRFACCPSQASIMKATTVAAAFVAVVAAPASAFVPAIVAKQALSNSG